MPGLVRIAGLVAEAAVVAVLLFKHNGLYLEVPLPLFVGVPLIVAAHGGSIKQLPAPAGLRWELFLLVGPMVLLSLSLVLGNAQWLIYHYHGASKEMVAASLNAGVSSECYREWLMASLNGHRSDATTSAALFVTSVLLYASRLPSHVGSAGKEKAEMPSEL